MMAAENHHPDTVMKLPIGKATDSLVFNSLSSTVPFAIPGAAEVIEKSSRSAPSSPVKEEKRRKGFFKHLPRPRSPSSPRPLSQANAHSDPERSPSPNTAAATAAAESKSSRPKWLIFKGPRRKKSKEINGSLAAAEGSAESVENLTHTPEPSATPAEELPGRTLMKTHSASTIPVITVSHSGEENHISGSLEDVNGGSGELRKMSQSSHCSSNFCSAATSGVGSLLSPSGDECYLGDDIESPNSPLSSRTSSFTEQVPGDLSDLDQMDLASPCSDQETIISPMSMASMTSPRMEAAPPLTEREKSPTELSSKQKRKKERSAMWDNLKKAVKAWSPFAVQFKKKCYPWVQLAGHQGNFMPGDDSGNIMKKSDPNERKALQALMADILKPFVPEFKKVIEKDGHMYVEMTDLLREFEEPAVMDIKMGLRTYLEEELRKKDLRPDMYEKMIQVDPNEPTESEHAQKAITKPRYMQWRESLSSSSTLGFRVEGIKTSAGKALKDFKETKAEEDVVKALRLFLDENPSVKGPFLRRLIEIKATLERSEFLRTHELIGSSLLFVYDSTNLCSIHMIDFGKTMSLPHGVTVDHKTQWVVGNHEDGYLLGLENLIRLWEHL